MRNRIIFLLIIMTLVTTWMWADTLYWRYWPFDPLEINGPIKIRDNGKMICAGGIMVYEMNIDKKMPLSAKVKRQLANSYQIDFTPLEVPHKNLGRQIVSSYIHIPGYVDEGMYTLRWTAEYQIGRDNRIISVSAKSEPFVIHRCGK